MKIAVISDIHLGSREFLHSQESFIRFLDYLESHFDRIVLLGDIFDLFYPEYPGSNWTLFNIIKNKYETITHRFFTSPYILVAGNHDWILPEKLGIPWEVIINDGQLSIYMTHGHQCDPNFLSPLMSWVSRTYMWFANWFRERGLNCLYDAGEKRDQALNIQEGGKKYNEFAQGKINEGYNLVVMGHTHVEKQVNLEGGVYFNTGDCLARLMYLSIDTMSGTSELHTFSQIDKQ